MGEEVTKLLPLLVGEANPYGSDPEFALYCSPFHSAGGRLCRLVLGYDVLGDGEDRYLEEWDRVNLCPDAWNLTDARKNAAHFQHSRIGGAVVLLGAKVMRAFGFGFQPFHHWRHTLFAARTHTTYVCLPHPSGLSRAWNEPGAPQCRTDLVRDQGQHP